MTTGARLEVPDILHGITRRIVSNVHPIRIVLFGSYARGTAGPDSDIDLLVVLPEVSDKRRQTVEIMRLLGNLTTPVDIVVTSPAEIEARGSTRGSVLRSALREGITVTDG